MPAAPARYFESEGYGFLEVERFDTASDASGARGSAGANDDELVGIRDNWPVFDQRWEEAGMSGPDSVRRVLVLSAFSELIGKGDRYFEKPFAHGRRARGAYGVAAWFP
ncbi:putative DNA-binding transcriptional regulator (plasmid) [Variovorax sp. RA8]|nr:putative DNA-binding transcriptional regulator [Variovorax sp. RA8]